MKIAGQPAQAQIGTLSLSRVSRCLDLVARCRSAGVRCGRGRFLRQQPVDMALRDVQPAKSIVRLRIGRTPSRDGRSDTRLDPPEPPEALDRRPVGAPTPTLPPQRW